MRSLTVGRIGVMAGFIMWGGAMTASEAPEHLLLAASFDQYVGLNWAVGSRALLGVAPQVVPGAGKWGQGLDVGSTGGGIVIVGDDGNFNPSEGTVQMWVCPNWNGDDGKVRQLFSAYVEKGNYLNCNKLATNTLGVATGAAGLGKYCRVEADIALWRAGEWHHVAFSWGAGRLAFFLDGERVGEVEDSVAPRRVVTQITIGRAFDGLLDELAIWSKRRDSFDVSAPLRVPDLGPVPLPEPVLPPVGELDRYHFALADSATGYAVAPKYFVDEVEPEVQPDAVGQSGELDVFAARGEWQSVGFVIYATADVVNLEVTADPLRSAGGAEIGSGYVRVYLNRRVLQRRAPRVRDDDRVPATALLDPGRAFDLPQGHFKEVTVTVRVPDDAPAGVYDGSVAISAPQRAPTRIPLRLEVLPFRLTRSPSKEYGVYLVHVIDLRPQARPALRADLRDLREHGVTHLFCHLGIDYERDGDGIRPNYERLDEGLSLLREFGFSGSQVIQSNVLQLARLLGHEDVSGHAAAGESLDGSEAFADHVERAIRGLEPLKARYPEFELVVTHMDEVLGKKRLPLYIRLTRAVRRVPEQRVYITLHTIPRPGVAEMTRELDPYMDIRCYNGHALDLWLQAGHTFAELGEELERSGDEGWMYYNPHRPFYTAKWSRVINGLYLWWSPLRVHCPFRYRTMRAYPLSFTHNMGYTVKSGHDGVTPVSTRQWEGYRLGMQDCTYFCMLQDLAARASEARPAAAAKAEMWLEHLRELMPASADIQEIDEKACQDYPVVYTVASRLDGRALDDIRRRTAALIIELRQALGVSD